ncbi:helix-turn-helix domain-containing protein [Kitasatospora sp. NPDC101183]|uniref:helix-turn-helix domain-containing protein n=1 Tax=Kitasatospora sp. NPDC101183 TaxID=3364100 RepID=UPI0037F3CD9B
MDQVEALRDFLMSRRARLRPDQVGLPVHGLRKVSGLRREEVAGLAAMSVEHYTRLERGRASCVSDTVLDAVSDALRLSPGERRYLRSLARPTEEDGGAGLPPERWRGLQSVLDSMAVTPAYLLGRGGAILAWNRLAAAVFLDFGRLWPEERTVGRLVFTDPRVPGLYADWEGKARGTVGLLRSEAGRWPRDEALAGEIRELREHSPLFRRLWDEHLVHEQSHATLQLVCARAGVPLWLSASALTVADHPDLVIAVYTAVPGSDSERALHRLARSVAPAGD